MRRVTVEEKKQYLELRKSLPRSAVILPETYWLQRIAAAVFEREAQQKWIDLKTLHQLCLDANLQDAEGPVQLQLLGQLLGLMFRRADFVFFDIYEVHRADLGRRSEDGRLICEPVFCFQYHYENLKRDCDYLTDLKAKLLEEENFENAPLPIKSEQPRTENA